MPTNKTIREEIREILTYHSRGGTSGYLISEEKFQELFNLIGKALLTQLQEIEDMVEGMKIPDVSKEGLQIGDASAFNQALSDVIDALKEKVECYLKKKKKVRTKKCVLCGGRRVSEGGRKCTKRSKHKFFYYKYE